RLDLAARREPRAHFHYSVGVAIARLILGVIQRRGSMSRVGALSTAAIIGAVALACDDSQSACDCASASCERAECAVERCHNGATDRGEDGVDCGGACGACGGAACAGAADCASGVCDGRTCVAAACVADPCQNGGVCLGLANGSRTCDCLDGWK